LNENVRRLPPLRLQALPRSPVQGQHPALDAEELRQRFAKPADGAGALAGDHRVAGDLTLAGAHQHAQFRQPFTGRALLVTYRVPGMHLDETLDLAVLKTEPTAGQGPGAVDFVEDAESPPPHLLPVQPPH